ncbi:MAG: C1 family peptidase [Bacteroidaceae bacterium]|nr:C1 family peptidase [Bacteroidaceae bacterium]
MRKTLILAVMMAAGTFAQAQTSITREVLNSLEGTYTGTPAEKAIRNALSSNSIQKMAVNQENTQAPDTYFSVEVKNTGISDQQGSGRCWLFTGTNVLRNRAMKNLGIKDFFFSQVYLFFYDQLEKSNLFLQGVIDTRKKPLDDQMVTWLFKNPLSDGGTYTGVADLVAKYGLVPQDVMAETYNSNSTSEFCGHLKRKLREFGIQLREKSEAGTSEKDLEKMKVEQLKTVYHLLVLAYGQPPKSFTWAPKKDGKTIGSPKTYTPQEFYKELCAGEDDLYADSVMLMNDPSRPFNQVYEIDYDRHLYDGHNWLYVNLDIEALESMAISSLKDSCQMYFSCDVGKFLDRTTGILDLNNFDYASLLGTTFGMNKKQRIQTFDSGSTHAMTLMAVDLDENGKPKKWKVENSWGEKSGYKGYMIMTKEWFREYMFRLVINKKYCTPQVMELLKKKPVKLPAWDPMFMGEE